MPMENQFSQAAWAAFSHWVLKVSGFHRLGSLVGRRGLPSAKTKLALAELAALETALARQKNVLHPRHDGQLLDAYKALGVHALSEWEESEIRLEAAVRDGRFDTWESTRVCSLQLDSELLLSVVHGHFGRVRPWLLRYAEEQPGTVSSLWFRWIATGVLDLAEASRQAQRVGSVGERLALEIAGSDPARGQAALEALTTPAERALSTKPVKSLPKLLAQVLAFGRGEIDADVLRKSFFHWFGFCYHFESPSNLWEKVGPAYLYGQTLDPKPAELLVSGIKEHLVMFTPKRRAARAVFVAQVEPVMAALRAITEVVRLGKGLTVVASEGAIQLLAAEPVIDRDYL